MANNHRVYLKNLNFTVTPLQLTNALNRAGLPQVTLDDINVVRSGNSNQCSLCSAFVTLHSAESVELSVQLLHGRVLPGCSNRALHAEKAIPRISQKSWSTTSKSSGSTVGGAASSDSGPSAADAAVARWLQVKNEEKEEKKGSDSGPSGVDAAVTHWVEVKREEKEEKKQLHNEMETAPTSPAEMDETPWERRVRKRTTWPEDTWSLYTPVKGRKRYKWIAARVDP